MAKRDFTHIALGALLALATVHSYVDGVGWTKETCGPDGIQSSADASTWATRVSGGDEYYCVQWVASLGVFIAVGDADLAYSSDGLTWTTTGTAALDHASTTAPGDRLLATYGGITHLPIVSKETSHFPVAGTTPTIASAAAGPLNMVGAYPVPFGI